MRSMSAWMTHVEKNNKNNNSCCLRFSCNLKNGSIVQKLSRKEKNFLRKYSLHPSDAYDLEKRSSNVSINTCVMIKQSFQLKISYNHEKVDRSFGRNSIKVFVIRNQSSPVNTCQREQKIALQYINISRIQLSLICLPLL